MRFRETNHLRKAANEAGKKMRGPRHSKSHAQQSAENIAQCARCGYMRYSHNPSGPGYDWSRKNGMCEEFVA
jgi:hypothetical protein